MIRDAAPTNVGEDSLDVLRPATCIAHIPDLVIAPGIPVKLTALVANRVLDTVNPEAVWLELSQGRIL